MSVVERLAELTGFRDRDLMDATLAAAMQDLLAPREVAVWRAVDDDAGGGGPRWLLRARLRDGLDAGDVAPPWAERGSLPRLAAEPLRHACLQHNRPVVGRGTPARAFFPLDADPEATGVLELHTAQPLDAASVRLVGSVLRVYRNFRLLLDDSERDTLTRLLNRKSFDACFLRALAPTAPTSAAALPDDVWTPDARRAAATSTAWLGVVDIDHFKRVNDGFGHLIGDEVLLLLARLMHGTFRCHDRLFRFGGEEFVALLRCPDAAGAALAFERLRANVERHAFPQVGRITVSAGYTQLRAGDSPSGAFERADKAVYHAKQHGRNQVRHHADLVAQGDLEDATRDSDVELF